MRKYLSMIEIDEESKKKILDLVKIPENWEIINHHMTIRFGEKVEDLEIGSEVELSIIGIGNLSNVVALMVEGFKSYNKTPHITVAIDRKNGGKPVMSNNILNWKPLEDKIKIKGIIVEKKLN